MHESIQFGIGTCLSKWNKRSQSEINNRWRGPRAGPVPLAHLHVNGTRGEGVTMAAHLTTDVVRDYPGIKKLRMQILEGIFYCISQISL